MTGTAPAANGAVGFKSAPWQPPHTLAGELSKAGYQTEMIGKLHLTPHRKRYGFDHMQLADGTRGADNDYVEWLRQYHRRHEVDPGMAHGISANGWVGRPHHLPEEQMHTFWCVDRAMDFLRKRDPSAPFFLNLSFIDPHPPLVPPAPYYDRYIHRSLPDPSRRRLGTRIRRSRKRSQPQWVGNSSQRTRYALLSCGLLRHDQLYRRSDRPPHPVYRRSQQLLSHLHIRPRRNAG